MTNTPEKSPYAAVLAEFPVGTRVRLRTSVERFPDVMTEAGETGTVARADADCINVRLDKYHPGIEEWENGVEWYGDNVDLHDYASIMQLPVQCEVITGPTDAEATLTAELEAFCAAHNLTPASADEVLMAVSDDNRDAPFIRQWLSDFIQRWEDAMAKEDAARPAAAADVYGYFRAAFGAAPGDHTLRDLPVDSVCGKDCVRVIDAAKAFGDAAGAADPELREKVAEIAFDAICVLWNG